MKLYLAGRYSRKNEIEQEANKFRNAGHEVTSTWFWEPHEAQVGLSQVPPDLVREYATRDLQELDQADGIVFYSESSETYNRRGGRHVEFGYALARNKVILVVGPRENIFHSIPGIMHFTSTEHLLQNWREE